MKVFTKEFGTKFDTILTLLVSCGFWKFGKNSKNQGIENAGRLNIWIPNYIAKQFNTSLDDGISRLVQNGNLAKICLI
tara:strand:+ start:306 stop:539 length:234 start_codon:yes stop_codon:yes gene_type:complete